MAKLGVVIPVVGQFEHTKNLIDNLKMATKSDYQILIINNSTEQKDTDDLNGLLSENMSMLQNIENGGCGTSWNQGLEYFKGYDFVAILNNDILVSEDWDINMQKAFEEDDNIEVVFPGVWARGEITKEQKQLLSTIKDSPANVSNAHLAGFAFILKADGNGGFGVGKFIDELKYWYTDTEYWVRVEKKFKKRMVSTSNVYVHHFESKTLKTLPDWGQQIQKDAVLYKKFVKEYE